jgi:16S rRNA (cytidine1402-2'-O)-methyltransferase
MFTMPGSLFLVATPIGNLKDITLRAVEILKSVDIVACEDTRHSRKLMNHFGIEAKLVSYHEHNEEERARELAKLLASGKDIAVVSDAGTPGISDPSFRLVNKAVEVGARVVPVPGPVAFVAAVTASGLPTDSVFFGSFLPSKKGERRKRLEEVRGIPATLAFYETPHRLGSSLADCLAVLGDRRAAVARELTKMHEETVRGSISELISHFESHPPKGEFVLVIDRASEAPETTSATIAERIVELEAEGLDQKTALKKAAKEFGVSKSEAYRELMVKK